MKVLIFGNGYLGNKFLAALDDEAVMSKTDICDEQAVRAEIRKNSPDTVLNCAGKTGKPNVDWCEDHKLETMRSNILGPLNLCRVCLEENVFMAHVGSGCVYEGDNGGKGFSEDDAPNFFGSYYSRTKFVSEQALKDFPVLQLRLRMPLDSEPSARNLVTKLAGYSKIIDIPNSISALDEFVPASITLMQRKKTGIYNITNPGAILHSEILGMYKEIVDPNHAFQLIPLTTLYTMTKAKRSNCVLSTKKIEAEGIKLKPVKQAVRENIIAYKKNLDAGKSCEKYGAGGCA